MSAPARSSRRRGLIDLGLVAIGLAVFALDQVTKREVALALGPGAPQNSVDVLGSFVRLSYTTNSGAAFGLFPDRTIVFTLVALLAVPLLLFSRLFISFDSRLVQFSLGLLLGGTIGNLADRARLGYVVDFVDVGINQARWPSFNVADSAFVVGVIILGIYMLFLAPEGETAGSGERPGGAGPAGREEQPGQRPVA